MNPVFIVSQFDADSLSKGISMSYIKIVVFNIQANFDMSNLLVLKIPPVSKWHSIPEHFPICVIVFQPRLCQTRLSQNLGYIELNFIPLKKVSIIFTTVYVEVTISA